MSWMTNLTWRLKWSSLLFFKRKKTNGIAYDNEFLGSLSDEGRCELWYLTFDAHFLKVNHSTFERTLWLWSWIKVNLVGGLIQLFESVGFCLCRDKKKAMHLLDMSGKVTYRKSDVREGNWLMKKMVLKNEMTLWSKNQQRC